MRRGRVSHALLAVLVVFGVASAACGSDDGRGDPGSPTPPAGRTLAGPPGTAPQPTPIPLSPVLPPGVQPLGTGYRTFVLNRGTSAELDTLQAARDAILAPPGCAALVFAMHWSVDGPGARNARVESVVQGTATTLGSGPEGRAVVGCALLRFSAPDTAFLNVAFAIGVTP